MMNGSQEILRALRPRTVIIRSIAATMSSGTKTTLRELNDEEVRRRRYPSGTAHTRTAHPFFPDLHRSIGIP